MNDGYARVLKFFEYTHLPSHLQGLSAPFHKLAHDMVDMVGDGQNPAEVTVGLRKLLEAKDCFVRAGLN